MWATIYPSVILLMSTIFKALNISQSLPLTGSDKERESVKRASHHSSRKDKLCAVYALQERQDVEFSYKGDTAQNGDITIVVSARNTAEESRNLKVSDVRISRMFPGAKCTPVDATRKASKKDQVDWSQCVRL